MIKKKIDKSRDRIKTRSTTGRYYVCLMQNSTYQIVFHPRAKDGVFIAYGPWKHDKCEWWLRVIRAYIKRGKELDLSKYEFRRFDKNKPEKEGTRTHHYLEKNLLNLKVLFIG